MSQAYSYERHSGTLFWGVKLFCTQIFLRSENCVVNIIKTKSLLPENVFSLGISVLLCSSVVPSVMG